jgi:hypothetical protein
MFAKTTIDSTIDELLSVQFNLIHKSLYQFQLTKLSFVYSVGNIPIMY